MKYGLPYQGSKNKIAQWVIEQLPSAENLYDLFAGGCAITHCALLSGKYENIICNDITDIPNLFIDAINGKYRDESRWISREDFFRLKDSDPYVRLCWSFGNNQREYLYSRELEPYKKAIHEMLFAPTVQERRVKYRSVIKELSKISTSDKSLESLERLQSLQSLQSLQNLQLDYRDIQIMPNSVIYCDIPYKRTAGYGLAFDYGAFYNWCEQQTHPVYISEYSMPEDRFVCIAEKTKRCSFSATNNSLIAIERIFIPQEAKQRVSEPIIKKSRNHFGGGSRCVALSLTVILKIAKFPESQEQAANLALLQPRELKSS